MTSTTTVLRRRSPRLLAANSTNADNGSDSTNQKQSKRRSSKALTTAAASKKVNQRKKKVSLQKEARSASKKQSLPRTRQLQIEAENKNVTVIGIDEAGRGPLAGPVVAAAIIIPSDIDGIIDSKKLTKEESREELYHKIMSSPYVRWAAAVINAEIIDDINILQATLLAMQSATTELVQIEKKRVTTMTNESKHPKLVPSPPPHIEESYVLSSCNNKNGIPMFYNQQIVNKSHLTMDMSHLLSSDDGDDTIYYALVDGNRVPPNMPVKNSESIVKGDGKEYCIGAASIIAKVTRDMIMVKHYHELYPEYNLKRHKGYPTAEHVKAIWKQNQISPIHRKTYAPLKHLEFNADGKILNDNNEVDT